MRVLLITGWAAICVRMYSIGKCIQVSFKKLYTQTFTCTQFILSDFELGFNPGLGFNPELKLFVVVKQT